MVQMGLTSLKEIDLAVAMDLESGTNAVVSEDEEGEALVEQKFGGEEESSPLEKKEEEAVGEKPKKKKSCKKPPRPPRVPSMDVADHKLIREISELAMLKRARIERMKALKRMKNAEMASSNGNLVPWVFTLIFCLVILWQGFFSMGSSSLRFHNSLDSSMGARGGFISVQFYNASADHGSSSASPNNVERVSGLDNHRGRS